MISLSILLLANTKCEYRSRRQSDLHRDYFKHNVALSTKINQLQTVAERVWLPGMIDRNGRKDPILGSIASDPYALYKYTQLGSSSNISTICEVGYNWGASSLLWLRANKHAKVFSFDLAERAYTNITLNWLNTNFKNRLQLIRGDSALTIPRFKKSSPDTKCDLIFIDGAHSEQGEFENIVSFQEYATKNTYIILDDCDCTSNPTSLAYKRALDMQMISHIEAHITTKIYKKSQNFTDLNERHSFCIGKYL